MIDDMDQQESKVEALSDEEFAKRWHQLRGKKYASFPPVKKKKKRVKR